MRKVLLFVILFLSAFLRLYRLGDYPALNADEAAIGYNAYSLIETGRDEHGNLWPVHFQSFNDYKPGLYFYLVLPFIKIFGLNEWAVRIPGALLGVATVVVVYLLCQELFGGKKFGIWNLPPALRAIWLGEEFGIFASFWLAISPWHIHFSRGAWEVNVATFFIATGVWLFLKAVKDPKYYVLCALFFVLSIYTYHAARIVTPLLGVGLLTIYRTQLKRSLKAAILAGVLALILLIPLGLDLTRGSVLSRAAGVGLFADPGPLTRINEQRGEHRDFKSLQAILLHNKPINYGLAFLENWSEHFWGEFLFLSGDEIQRDKVPETGQMYLLDIIFLFVGFVAIAKRPEGWSPILTWLIVAPTAAALTFQSPHALRAHNMVIPLVILSAYGFFSMLNYLKVTGSNRKQPVGLFRFKPVTFFLLLGLILFGLWNFFRYFHMYYTHMAKEYPFSAQYGVKELVSYIKPTVDKYEKVVVTDEYDQPYILFLFYLKYPPEKFQIDHLLTPRDKFGFSTVRSFDKYQFRPIDFDEIRSNNPNSLIIGTDGEIPDEANVVKEIYGQNGYLYFQVVAN